VAITMHYDLKAIWHRASRFALFSTKFVLRVRINCYFWTSGQHFNTPIAVGFGDPDFLYTVLISWRSVNIHLVTLTFDPLTLNICHMLLSVLRQFPQSLNSVVTHPFVIFTVDMLRDFDLW